MSRLLSYRKSSCKPLIYQYHQNLIDLPAKVLLPISRLVIPSCYLVVNENNPNGLDWEVSQHSDLKF